MAIFRSSRIVPERKVKLNMCESCSEMSVPIALIIRELIPSYPGLFWNSNFFFYFIFSYWINKEASFTAISEIFIKICFAIRKFFSQVLGQYLQNNH